MVTAGTTMMRVRWQTGNPGDSDREWLGGRLVQIACAISETVPRLVGALNVETGDRLTEVSQWVGFVAEDASGEIRPHALEDLRVESKVTS